MKKGSSEETEGERSPAKREKEKGNREWIARTVGTEQGWSRVEKTLILLRIWFLKTKVAVLCTLQQHYWVTQGM